MERITNFMILSYILWSLSCFTYKRHVVKIDGRPEVIKCEISVKNGNQNCLRLTNLAYSLIRIYGHEQNTAEVNLM